MKYLNLFVWVLLFGFANARAYAQSSSEKPAFEVASIKPDNGGSTANFTGIRTRGTFTAENVTLRGLIMNAYDVRAFQIVGGPNWIDSDRFDITAKPRAEGEDQESNDPAKEWAEMVPMLQSLLEQRFNLESHRETIERSVYALRVVKDGPKLIQSNCIEFDPSSPPPKPQPWQSPTKICGGARFGKNGLNRTLDGAGITTGGLSKWALATVLGNVVLDETGLTRKYDVHLEWAPDDLSANAAAAQADVDQSNSALPTAPSLFTALQEQLGLRIETTRAPVEVIVIDRVDKPTAN